MNVVIGSGPAGAACAWALARRGLPVTVIDTGLELEPERRARIASLRQLPPEEWNRDAIEDLRSGLTADANGFFRKLAYGSDFPYRTASADRVEAPGVALTQSHAKGGLSNVWGGAVLPYGKADLRDWPFDAEALAPHYAAAMTLMHVSAVEDALAEEFPLYGGGFHPLPTSPQVASVLRRLNRRRDQVEEGGIQFGHSRLAVRAHSLQDRSGCVQCGLCLHGCPHQLIYNAADTVTLLERGGKLEYRGGWVVEKLEPVGSGVRIRGRSLVGETLSLHADRVYLACGAINTTRILLESLEQFDKPVTIKDSQYFLAPALQLSRVPGARSADVHTLSQLFLEMNDPSISPHRIHLQLYGYNDLYSDAVQKAFGRLCGMLGRTLNPLLDRLMAVQGYLHSQDSSAMRLHLRPPTTHANRRFAVEAVLAPGAASIVRDATRKLVRLGSNLGFFLIPQMVSTGAPGQGSHFGGSFPMMAGSEPFRSDTLGRPAGLDNVHVVDSTTFPTIPAGPITLTVMANAIRIASEAG